MLAARLADQDKTIPEKIKSNRTEAGLLISDITMKYSDSGF
jgi:hypothetical protein